MTDRKARLKKNLKQIQADKKVFQAQGKTESQDQSAFLVWFRKTYPDVLILHIPNGQSRKRGQQAKQQGQVNGVPDLFIPAWKVWIEFKQATGGTVSAEQKKVMAYLQDVSYNCFVTHGIEDAKESVESFLRDNPEYGKPKNKTAP